MVSVAQIVPRRVVCAVEHLRAGKHLPERILSNLRGTGLGTPPAFAIGHNEPMADSDRVMPVTSGLKLTYDDFVLFPDDGKRHELIDGEHVTPSPEHEASEGFGATCTARWVLGSRPTTTSSRWPP